MNSADSDQFASSEANWSGSKLFSKAGHIQVQQDGLKNFVIQHGIQMLLTFQNYPQHKITWATAKNCL